MRVCGCACVCACVCARTRLRVCGVVDTSPREQPPASAVGLQCCGYGEGAHMPQALNPPLNHFNPPTHTALMTRCNVPAPGADTAAAFGTKPNC